MAVEWYVLIDELSRKVLSRRAACRWAGYSRAVGRYVLRRPVKDAERLEIMRKAAKANPRYSHRRIAVVSGLGIGCTWRLHYNTQRPHNSLDCLTPAAFAAQYSIQPDQTLIPDGQKN